MTCTGTYALKILKKYFLTLYYKILQTNKFFKVHIYLSILKFDKFEVVFWNIIRVEIVFYKFYSIWRPSALSSIWLISELSNTTYFLLIFIKTKKNPFTQFWLFILVYFFGVLLFSIFWYIITDICKGFKFLYVEIIHSLNVTLTKNMEYCT